MTRLIVKKNDIKAQQIMSAPVHPKLMMIINSLIKPTIVNIVFVF